MQNIHYNLIYIIYQNLLELVILMIIFYRIIVKLYVIYNSFSNFTVILETLQ